MGGRHYDFLLSAMDAHDIGAMDRVNAMPKRQEAIPALRRRLGLTGSAAVRCSLAAAAGQVKDAAQQSAPARVDGLLLKRRAVDGAFLNPRFRSAVVALNNP